MKKVNAAPAATGFAAFISRNSDYPKNSYKMKPAYQFPQSSDYTTRGTHSAENQKKLSHMKKLLLPFKTLAITVLIILIGTFAQTITKTWTGGAFSTAWATSGNWNPVGAPEYCADVVTGNSTALAINASVGNGDLLINGSTARGTQDDYGITCPASITVGTNITTTDASDAGYRQFAFYQNSFNPAIQNS